jgi:hypothetical protein
MIEWMWDIIKNYRGEWVAVSGRRILAHGKDPVRVFRRARKVAADPLVFPVPTEEDENSTLSRCPTSEWETTTSP